MAQAAKTTEAVPLPDAASDHGSRPCLAFRRATPALSIAGLIARSTLICIPAIGECLTAAHGG